jgi:hypothetical protein
MSFRVLTWAFYGLISAGVLLLSLAAIASAIWPIELNEKLLIAAVCVSAIGTAFLVNCAAGIRHGKLRTRAGSITALDRGRAMFVLEWIVSCALGVAGWILSAWFFSLVSK